MAHWLMLIILLVLFDINSTDILQWYRLTDNLGRETSYPFENGNLEIFCNGTENGKTTHLMNATGKLYVKMNNTKFRLEAGLSETKYYCDNASKEKFKIGILHCDHFDLIPKIVCKDKQWCMIAKDGHANCEVKNPDYCYMSMFALMTEMFDSSFPKFRTACINKAKRDNEANIYGLCQAKSNHTKVIIGLSETPAACTQLNSLTINGSPPVVQDQVVIIPISEKSWEFKYVDYYMSCELTDSVNTSYGSVSRVRQSTLTPNISADRLPMKLKFECVIPVFNGDDFTSKSAYIIVYDSDPSKYKVTINKKYTFEGIELTCACEVPDGLVCGLTWDVMPNIPKGLIVNIYYCTFVDILDVPEEPTKRLLVARSDVDDTNYTCFLKVFAYDYPNTFKLIYVPIQGNLQDSVVITHKDFISGGNGGNDSDFPKYSVEIKKKISSEGIELSCTCKGPKGFVCGFSWENMRNVSDGLMDFQQDSSKKTLTADKHVDERNYTCFLQVFAYENANSSKLIQVPLKKNPQASVIVSPQDFMNGSNIDSSTEGWMKLIETETVTSIPKEDKTDPHLANGTIEKPNLNKISRR